ncbi:MAG: endonuclease [Clostridia bacterium]|nr:endonuclease [Clostridia bacterium]
MRLIGKILKVLLCIILALVLLLVLAVGVFTIAEYRPADTETIIEQQEAAAVLETGKPLTIVSWNCGYGALGDNADFFMDGGSSVYTADKARVESNLAGIRDTLKALNPDLLILQEVDIGSARSYGLDERSVLRDALPGASEAFAYNFNTLFVPFPMPPIGHVESGLYTLSNAVPESAVRISLPVPFTWPIRLFNLKRCLLVSRFPVRDSDRELVLINLHLEAYDDGVGKEAQARQLTAFMQEEYAKGNYVIAGGDFNQRFTNIDQSAYPVYEGMWQPGVIEAASFGSNFSLLMDNSSPTCRSLDRTYAGAEKDGFQFYLIDGFIVSANVRAESVETLDYNFVCSDHNPVRMSFTLE